jgi:hypothetical protein
LSENLKRVLLIAEVEEQKLTLKKVKEYDELVEKSQNFLQMSFVFSKLWKSSGLEKIICQFRKGDGVYDVEVENDVCDVPWEVLTSNGYVEVCVYALGEGNTVITTGSDSFKVEGGAYKSPSLSTTEATQTVYGKLVEDVEKIKSETVADVNKLKTETAKSVEILTEDAEETKKSVEDLKSNAEETKSLLEILEEKTRYVSTEGNSVLSDNAMEVVAVRESVLGISEEYKSWSDILSGIRFTKDGIELKSGNSKVLLNGDEIRFTANGSGISIGANGTQFVGDSPYEGVIELMCTEDDLIMSCDIDEIKEVNTEEIDIEDTEEVDTEGVDTNE